MVRFISFRSVAFRFVSSRFVSFCVAFLFEGDIALEVGMKTKKPGRSRKAGRQAGGDTPIDRISSAKLFRL